MKMLGRLALPMMVFGLEMLTARARADEAKVVGQLGMIQGEVSVNSVRVRGATPVKEGAVIEVKEDSRATLLLGRGSVFHLGAESKMIVKEFGIVDQGRDEKAEVEFVHGKTRGLFLSQGPKRSFKIKTRAATMGVRGTEILIDAPRDPSFPVKFVTLEGLAHIEAGKEMPPVPLPQNQSLSAQEGGAKPISPPAPVQPKEVQANLAADGLSPEVRKNPGPVQPPPIPPGMNRPGLGGLSEGFGLGPGVPLPLDPLRERVPVLGVIPQFCSGATGSCN